MNSGQAEYTFTRAGKGLSGILVQGSQLLKEPVNVNLYRASTDNDRGWAGMAARWQQRGLDKPLTRLTRFEALKQGGKITAMMKLLPVVKPAFQMFPVILKEMGYENLILKKS